MLSTTKDSTTDGERRQAEDNALLAFGAEGDLKRAEGDIKQGSAPVLAADPRPGRPLFGLRGRALAVAGVGLLAVVGASAILARLDWIPLQASAPQLATLTIDSRPTGADVLVDGQMRGNAPVTVTLAAGTHQVTLRRGHGDAAERSAPVTIAAGSVVSQYFDMPAETPVAPTARMSVVTDPPGARVTIDGEMRGTSPVTLAELAAGDHKITVASESGSAERTVKTQPGETTSVVFSLTKTAGSPLAGWVAIAAPFEVRVLEDDTVVGAGRSARIMMPAGRHTVAIVNDSFQFQETRTVEVSPGKTANIRLDAPKVVVSANARPWADVVIDGVSVGQTPIANLQLAIGQHDVVFRNPQFAERRQTVVVTARGPNRIAVDLTK